MGDARRLVELFKKASSLAASEQEAFVRRVRDEDPELGDGLADLLGQEGPIPTEPGSFARRLEEQYGTEADPHISLDGESEGSDFASEVVRRLAGRGEAYGRYRLKGELARGGQGAILRVWDEDLRRNLAMKVVLGKTEATGDTPRVESRTLGRFLEEAQITGQLDHPGIVPVHELGLDHQGQVYFTMKLVKGQDLRSIFDLVHEEREDWTQTRALHVLLKVCEAMAYAHSKGVIHRDLKPGNVMVGRYGEVYVMDWGLARVLGREDHKDIRIKPQATTSELRSERHERAGETPDSPLVTMDGDIVGTPAYMSPEQANGDLEAMGPHSDVYAAGAMLYHLLTGHMPYASTGARLSNYAVWALVQQGPPAPSSRLRQAPVELVSVCEKAMERDVSRRYPNMSALAADLRAFLEGRVVQAHHTGALVELRKWVERNRPLAGAIAAGLVALLAGMTASWLLKRQSDQNFALAVERGEALARMNEGLEQRLSALVADNLGLNVQDLLWRLQQISDEFEDSPVHDEAATNPREFYRELFDGRMLPLVQRIALEAMEKKLQAESLDHAELLELCSTLSGLTGDPDLPMDAVRDRVLAYAPDVSSSHPGADGRSLNLTKAFRLRAECGPVEALLPLRTEQDDRRLARLCRLAIDRLEACVQPGSRTQPRHELGYMLAWHGAEEARRALLEGSGPGGTRATIQLANTFSRSMATLGEIQEQDLVLEAGGRTVRIAAVMIQGRRLVKVRRQLAAFLEGHGAVPAPDTSWDAMGDLFSWTSEQFEGHEGPINLSALGLRFGSKDSGQTLFQMSEAAIGAASGKITVDDVFDPAKSLDDPPGLRQLCDRSLPCEFQDGELSELARKLRDIVTLFLGPAEPDPLLLDVLRAECREFTDSFVSRVRTPEQAMVAFQGREARLLEGDLSIPLVVELAGLHRTLRDLVGNARFSGPLRDTLLEWQGHVEGLLYAHLEEARAESWIPRITVGGYLDEEAWNAPGTLAGLAELDVTRPGFEPLVETVERDVFVALTGLLEHHWKVRGGDLEQVEASVSELSRLAQQIHTRCPNFHELDLDDYLRSWAARVDSLLGEELRQLEEDAGRPWKPDVKRQTLVDSLLAAQEELESIQQRITAASQREGSGTLGPILGVLAGDRALADWIELPQVSAAARELVGRRVPTTASQVLNEPEYLHLALAIRALLEADQDEQGFGRYLARVYADDFSSEDSRASMNAGITLVRETKRQLGEVLLAEIKRRYLADLESLLGRSRYRTLLDVLFREKDQQPHDHDDVDVRDELGELLDPEEGDLHSLMREYRLTGVEEPIGALVFPAAVPREGENGWAALHRFLFGLQGFLFAGGAMNLREVTLDFTIKPLMTESGSVWALGSIPAEERRDFFYYPRKASSEELEAKLIGGQGTRMRVSEWGFGGSRPDPSLLLIWSKLPVQAEARVDPNRYYYEARGCLAPLLLAWSGMPVDEEKRLEFRVDITPMRSTRPAPLIIEFDRPLPLRPPRP